MLSNFYFYPFKYDHPELLLEKLRHEKCYLVILFFQAVIILQNVEDRLDGYCVAMKNLRLNLSIEGQVHQLLKACRVLPRHSIFLFRVIVAFLGWVMQCFRPDFWYNLEFTFQDATSLENLSQMYIGWAAYL